MEHNEVFDFSYIAESYHVPQQAQEPHDLYSMVESALHTPFSEDLFTNDFHRGPDLFEQILSFPIQEQYSNGSISNVQATPAGPMGSQTRTRKRKAPTLRAEDWEPVKSRVLELHITQDLPLPKVKNMIEDEFGFAAELRQYRTRLTQWGKDKNVKPHEMSAIVRKRQCRKIFESNKRELAFEVRGLHVEPQKIVRWMKRNDVPEGLPYASSPAASTPSAIACRTVSEYGSPITNMNDSPVASLLSPIMALGITSEFNLSSPTFSISKTPRPLDKSFADASPALTLQYSPEDTFLTRTSSQDDTESMARPTKYRYEQNEEGRLRRDLSNKEHIHGRNSLKNLGVLEELWFTVMSGGRYDSAEKFIRREVEICQSAHGNDSPDTIAAMNRLGIVLRCQGRYTQAEKIHRCTFKAGKEILGKPHPDTLVSLNLLGVVLHFQGRLTEARKIFGETLTLRKSTLGAEHPDTLSTMNALADVYLQQGKLVEAIQIHNKVLPISRLFGNDHEITLKCMQSLIATLHAQKKFGEAGKLQEEQCEIVERLLGKEHPFFLSSLVQLAQIYRSQGRLLPAADAFLRTFEIRKKVLGERHPETLHIGKDLVSIFEMQGRWAEANELDQQMQAM